MSASGPVQLLMTLLSILLIGLAMCVVLNFDALEIGHTLWTQPAVRDGIVAMAEKVPMPADGASAGETTRQMAQVLQQAQADVGIPLGWKALPATPGAWGLKLVGFFASALALSLGARFWFDMLKNLLSLRAGNKPESPPKS